MKKAFVGVSAYLAATMTALAADLPERVQMPAVPVAVPVVFNWTGCYLGIEGGGNWGRSEQIARSSVDAGRTITGPFDLSGGIAGGTVGCNYQTGDFVIGLENDFSWTNKKGSVSDLPPFNIAAISSTREKWIDTLRPRFGYAWDRFMIYGTAGAAWAGTDVNVLGPVAPGGVTDSQNRVGWTAGLGGEWAAWTAPWGAVTFKLEYLHADFGTRQYVNPPVISAGGTVVTRDVKLTDDMFRAGMNVKFNWGGPVVARY